MSVAVVHDRLVNAAIIESAVILLPSGRRRKQNLRTGFRARCLVCPSAGSGYPLGGDGCPLGRSGRPFRRRGDLSGQDLSGVHGLLAARRGCPSGGQV